jgi:hypothetical protein
MIGGLTFHGGSNSEEFNIWLEKTTVIIDNDAFHKSPKTK